MTENGKLIRIIHADGREEAREGTSKLPYDEERRIVGDPGPEVVWVLHQGRRTCMIVNECGAIEFANRPPLPVNEKATQIYHAARRSFGEPCDGLAQIHGTAIVYEGIQVA